MSWATSTIGTNNIYRDFPPIMHDGRNYADWQPGSVINDNIRKDAKISNNWDYRQYLTKNADTIIRLNQLNACGEIKQPTPVVEKNDDNTTLSKPYSRSQLNNWYTFGTNQSGAQPVFEQSDLKNIYLSDISLQSRMTTPVITQYELIKHGYSRAN